MTGDHPASTTPAQLRNGTPDALAAVCHSRGAAVFAYCTQLVGRDDAAEVTAEAFAQLRLAILAPGSLTSKQQAEELLRSVSRHAAMSHLVNSAEGRDRGPRSAVCAGRERELLNFVGKTLTPADRRVVDAHVGHCHRCASVLRRLEAAEPAFSSRPRTKLPLPIAREIVTALATAAPVSAHEGDATAVRDEALSLLVERGDVMPAAAVEETAPITQTTPARIAEPPVKLRRAAIDRLRERLPWAARDSFNPSRARMLMRDAFRLAAVVVVAGAAGTLLGVGIAALTGGESSSSAPLDPTSTAPPSPTARLPVEVLSTTVRPAFDGDGELARVSVRLRVENASGRTVRPEPPRLLVDDVRAAPVSASTAGGLLATSLDPGAVADGTLRFELRSRTAGELTRGRVRLRIAGKTVVLNPLLGTTTTATTGG